MAIIINDYEHYKFIEAEIAHSVGQRQAKEKRKMLRCDTEDFVVFQCDVGSMQFKGNGVKLESKSGVVVV